ncbi:hypothetical protein ERW51_18740 [Aliivibrio finisterrensis]|uniref:DUF6680 family protein n=1 Tax=Aliivibrio finisterrensis TaxID=511998 RepID=UPI0010222FB4|nr:DUF6680 family protein [Aliivibrio finisterrensis]RYU62667.1 hypothetical protein ERW54_19200 [Aliivibrio finisterrensis]RYU64505.1 hypothetical protein ERW51_18740 [Aliivibrio finisterrensis]RYU68337.1 hypothetical protein ERW48_19305 [Aliivibrio finisterrensis]
MEIIAVLVSPIIAILISLWLTERLQKRRDRLDIFKTLMTTRENNLTLDFVKSVNAIDVVFHNRSSVREAWRELYNSYNTSDPDLKRISDNHTKLLEAMAKDLGYKDQITWEHITSSYTPNWLLSERRNEADFKLMQMELMRNTVKVPVKESITEEQP